MTAIDCSLSSGLESHTSTNHQESRLIRTADNEPGHDRHSYSPRTERSKSEKKKEHDREQTTQVMSSREKAMRLVRKEENKQGGKGAEQVE